MLEWTLMDVTIIIIISSSSSSSSSIVIIARCASRFLCEQQHIYPGAIQCTIRPIQWAYKDTLESLRLGRSRPLKPTAQGYGANCDIAADIEQSPWPIASSPLHNKLQAASSESKQHNTTRSFPLFNHNILLLLPCCCCCRFRAGT
jgi:hypothetical protein